MFLNKKIIIIKQMAIEELDICIWVDADRGGQLPRQTYTEWTGPQPPDYYGESLLCHPPVWLPCPAPIAGLILNTESVVPWVRSRVEGWPHSVPSIFL